MGDDGSKVGSGYAWEGFFFFNVESEKELWIFEMRKQKDRIARETFGALLSCGKPKSSGNIKWRKRLREIEAKVFTWFGYVCLHPQDEA